MFIIQLITRGLHWFLDLISRKGSIFQNRDSGRFFKAILFISSEGRFFENKVKDTSNEALDITLSEKLFSRKSNLLDLTGIPVPSRCRSLLITYDNWSIRSKKLFQERIPRKSFKITINFVDESINKNFL